MGRNRAKGRVSRDDSIYIAADFEAQRLTGLELDRLYPRIERHFRYSILVSRRVLIPAADIFQSLAARRLQKEFGALFRNGDNYAAKVQISISHKRNTIAEDAVDKCMTYPDAPEYGIYRDPEKLKQIVSELDGIEPYLRRGTLRNTLDEVVHQESREGGILWRALVDAMRSEQEAGEVLRPLLVATREQKYAIVPAYLRTLAAPAYQGESYMRMLEFILLKAYCKSCEALYGGYCNNPLAGYYQRLFLCDLEYVIDPRDTLLFEVFLIAFPLLKERIDRLDAWELIKLRESSAFACFLEFYRQFVERVGACMSPSGCVPTEEKLRNLALGAVAQERSALLKHMADYVGNWNWAMALHRAVGRLLGRSVLVRNHLDQVDFLHFPIHGLLREIDERCLEFYEEELYRQVKAHTQEKRGREKMSHKVSISNSGTLVIGDGNTVSVEQKSMPIQEELRGIFNMSAEDREQLRAVASDLRGMKSAPEVRQERERVGDMLEDMAAQAESDDAEGLRNSVSRWKEFGKTASDKLKTLLQVLADGSTVVGLLLRIIGL